MQSCRRFLAAALLLCLAGVASCTVGARRRTTVASTTSEPARPVFTVDFNTATIAFLDRTRLHSPRLKVDHTACLAVGVEWNNAEVAVIDALKRDRHTAQDLEHWPSLQDLRTLHVWHGAFSDWHDAERAASNRRRGRHGMTDAVIRITAESGYLFLWGPDGTQTYCFAIQRSGSTVVLLPRLVDMMDF